MEKRLRITILGAVQGVGFRPFVYRTAAENGLTGWVINDPEGVTIEVEGSEHALAKMVEELRDGKPVHAHYEQLVIESLKPTGYPKFEIRKSSRQGSKKVLMQPDIATCPECLEEIFDSESRRYLYPFTNCTHCGPRYSIIRGLPYDRPQTTMSGFPMCEHCRQEYDDPENRRFHAQPNACSDCGPQVELWDTDGTTIANLHEAMIAAAEEIKKGRIVALKGLGGFQLLVDASNEAAIARLRKRKHRKEKPLALMAPSLKQARDLCSISNEEEELLTSPQAPIVILNRRDQSLADIAPSVAPDHRTLGIMLPYTPLHHILMRLIGAPVVATSGNLSDEPICIDEHEALERMEGIADLYLVHDRPIERHVDDSIVRMVAGEPTMLRRARGYAPFPVSTHLDKPEKGKYGDSFEWPTILALGGHLKNSIAVNRGAHLFISQHIGDLETYEATRAYHKVTDDLPALYDLQPEWIVHDNHPGYYSTKDAKCRNLPSVGLQHHYAHLLSCMAEHSLEGPLLGVVWDGTGFGTDETIWGGEFLHADSSSWERIAAFRRFLLPGGDKAIKEPRRAAIGLLYEIFGEQVWEQSTLPPVRAFTRIERDIIQRMLIKRINTHTTSSAGRIFDAVASLLNIRHKTSYEGQAAIALEHLLPPSKIPDSYEFDFYSGTDHWIIDWESMIGQIMHDLNREKAAVISNKFHNTLSEIILRVAEETGLQNVILSGGCFQNAYLAEHAITLLKKNGFQPYVHHQIPPNDGGIAAGQLYYALNNIRKCEKAPVHDEVPG